mmetsp:Transcript_5773/g.19663  ORF Transcript_5773/g.19663 Transcript_5773/m.19663 type:complete len:210 (+) Transcript_5773:194-823(+)
MVHTPAHQPFRAAYAALTRYGSVSPKSITSSWPASSPSSPCLSPMKVGKGGLAPPGSPTPRTASLTLTMSPLPPGTLPTRKRRFLGTSTLYTTRLCTVRVLLPMLPGIFLPLTTLPPELELVPPPMAPGARCVLVAPWEAFPPLNPWRFMTPAKPFPREVPCTSTSCPGTKCLARSRVPMGRSASGETRNSARSRFRSRPRARKWRRAA